MIGNPTQDQQAPQYDALDQFGAGNLYRVEFSRPAALSPQDLTVSNKPSEHNVFNMGTYVSRAQLAGQTTPPDLKRRLSHPALLPGSKGVKA